MKILPRLNLTQDTALSGQVQTTTFYGWDYSDAYALGRVWRNNKRHPQAAGRGSPDSMTYDGREFGNDPDYCCEVTTPSIMFGDKEEVAQDVRNALDAHAKASKNT